MSSEAETSRKVTYSYATGFLDSAQNDVREITLLFFICVIRAIRGYE